MSEVKYKVKEGLTKEMFIDTKWNVSYWTFEQKTLWQETMFDLGFELIRDSHSEMFMEVPYIYVQNNITCGDSLTEFCEYLGDHKHFSDVFDIIKEEETSTDDVLIINSVKFGNTPKNCLIEEQTLRSYSHTGGVGITSAPLEAGVDDEEDKPLKGVGEDLLEKVGLSSESKTDWTDTHYNQNYILTEEDIEKGYVRLDAYLVAKVWRIGSKDDSGALWHTFKVFPRYGEKNDKEREIKAMYAQIKALAKIEGVKLD